MPVPKKRLGSSAQNHRRSQWKAKQPLLATCNNCGAPRLPHTICGQCGYYNGKIVSVRFARRSGFDQSE